MPAPTVLWANAYAMATHASLLDLGHQVVIQYGYQSECDSTEIARGVSGFVVGSATYNASSSRPSSEVTTDAMEPEFDQLQQCRLNCNFLPKSSENFVAECVAACNEKYDPDLEAEEIEEVEWI